MARRLLFVGREGALIERGPNGRIDNVEDLRLTPGVIPALLRFVRGGYELVVLDDASARTGSGSRSTVSSSGSSASSGSASTAGASEHAEVERFLETLLRSQGISLAATLRCTHSEPERCGCRKPGLGLVRDYLAGNTMDRDFSAVVGDRAEDLELAANMGLKGFSLVEAAQNGEPAAAYAWPDIAHALLDRPRIARVSRRTRETDISIELDLDREAEPRAATGIGFFDHMLEQLGKHAGIALAVTCRGDLEIDEHHTVEDVALALGQALRQALGDKRGIGRYGFVLPMDEAEAEVALDLGGRPYLVFDGTFGRDRVGELPTELVPHFFRSLAETLGAAVHVKLRGENAHHMVEAAFKGFARALRQACARSGETLPSTKGVL